ncbi:uncharacterized protein LOC131025611 [Salvia miltiorrhiza]|uniref:uncharacterized protein LOC131025611 n=1 Tax=Salvia miltiorrhiza TaxID=226208 RepID=UPI0025AB90AC|nr:uncharacterized protein LOC131025611 [Salvia miltiorrhiza]
MASARRKKNNIIHLQREDGSWTENDNEIRIVACGYFEGIFDESNSATNYLHVLDRFNPNFDSSMNDELIKPFLAEEFKVAVSQMHPDKSPGSDEFNPKFFQNFWNMVGEDVYHSCCSWLDSMSFPPDLNHTLVTPHSKAIHFMKRKTRGKHGSLALKIDISKAYDRVDWGYLDAILQMMGFCDKWRAWMNLCVRTVSYEVLVNGEAIGPIIQGRGLRQGDPLSPYLIILCAEGL